MKSILSDQAVLKRLLKTGMLNSELSTDEETVAFRRQDEKGEPLPEGIIWSSKDDAFIKIDPSELSPENEQHNISVVQTLYLKSINGWLTFFGVLTILGLIGGLITIIAVFA